MASHMMVIKNQITSAMMNKQVIEDLKNCTVINRAINEELNPAQMAQTMKSFAMEMDKAGIQLEITNDAFAMLEDPAEQSEAADVYDQILADIGLEYRENQPAIPIGNIEPARADPNSEAARQAAEQ